jgi:hypothetical protein
MKRLKLILIIFILTWSNILFAQIQRDSILKKTENYFFIVDNQNYIIKNNNRNINVTLNDSTINKIKGIFSMTDFHYNSNTNRLYTFYNRSMKSLVWSLNIKNGNIERIFKKKNKTRVFTLNNKEIYFKRINTNNDSLFKSLIKSKEEKQIPAVNKYLQKNNLSIGTIISFHSNNNILISTGYLEQGGFLNPNYHIYNLQTKSLKKFKQKNTLNSVFGEYGILVNHYDISKKYVFLDSTIIDSNFNYYSSYLRGSLASDIRGFVFSDNELKRIIVLSEIDEKDRFGNPGKSVLIQYTPSPHRERIMYRLYHNKIIDKEELERFDAFELRLFRNMIFAKYNYDFNDKYLTAYFNMYGFYRPHKDTRTKDMSGKLTEADKKNLELIKKMENEM